MSAKRQTKLVHEGKYAAKVDVEPLDDGNGWGPYLSLADTEKLDDVREALRRGDVKTAARHGRVSSLTLITV